VPLAEFTQEFTCAWVAGVMSVMLKAKIANVLTFISNSPYANSVNRNFGLLKGYEEIGNANETPTSPFSKGEE
jgi:hypothetical protein